MARFQIAAAHKSSGKTVVTTGLARALRYRGMVVQGFKKGPDYIDPLWLERASGRPCYNLDFNTMEADELTTLFGSRSADADISLIESNKGLYDGVDLHGADSNAAMAKLLRAPVILVVDTNGMTRGIAPLLLGYSRFDPDIRIAGVILNKVGGPRHEGKLRAAVAEYTDIPVLGAVHRASDLEIGERHLGLTTPAETGNIESFVQLLGQRIADSVDLDAIVAIARSADPLEFPPPKPVEPFAKGLRIAIPRDAAFSFYYPDDIEAMRAAGAVPVFFDALADAALPVADGLFIGGGFPETAMDALQANSALRENIRSAIENGLPAYAECGGLMYLCRSLSWRGERREMVGVVPGDAVMHPRPQGRGYTKLRPTADCPWPDMNGIPLKAHEFHYASVEGLPDDMRYGFDVARGAGISGRHDGVVIHNLMAGFCHMRSSAANPWVERFLRFVKSKQA